MDLKYLFVCIYLAVDILYVVLSKPFYNKAIQNIQGFPMKMKKYTSLSAAISYLIMGIGWITIVANRVTPSTSYEETFYIALMYGLAIFGVFNTTLYVMFEKWDLLTAIRDTCWGTGWILTISFLYLYTLKSFTRQ